jgi:hypothetical protein
MTTIAKQQYIQCTHFIYFSLQKRPCDFGTPGQEASPASESALTHTTIRPGDDGPVEAVRPTGDATTNDMALPLSVICTKGTIERRNEAH